MLVYLETGGIGLGDGREKGAESSTILKFCQPRSERAFDSGIRATGCFCRGNDLEPTIGDWKRKSRDARCASVAAELVSISAKFVTSRPSSASRTARLNRPRCHSLSGSGGA